MWDSLEKINGIVSVPPTKSGKLVEVFARRIADMLHIRYLPVLVKVRSTEEQKNFTNAVQKEHNVKNAFSIHPPQSCARYTLLLIDDIYDSGYTLRAAAKALRKDGALAVYPFTITRTLHSDDQ